MMTDTHTHAYPWSYVAMHKRTPTSRAWLPGSLPLHTHTHTQVAVYWRVGWWWHTLIPMPTLDCLHRHIFLLHVYRSVALARMRRYMQLAYLFHQYAKSLLSTDGRIVDCTVNHPGVERPFSSSSLRKCPLLSRYISLFLLHFFHHLFYF